MPSSSGSPRASRNGGRYRCEVQALVIKGGSIRKRSPWSDRLLPQCEGSASPIPPRHRATALNRANEAIGVSRTHRRFSRTPEPYNNLAVLYAQQHSTQGAVGARNGNPDASATRPHTRTSATLSKLGDSAYDKALQLDAANRERNRSSR